MCHSLFLMFLCVVSSLQSRSSLEMMESQSCDAEPPPPPKPELRYPGITRGNTEGKSSLTHCSISDLRFLLWNLKLTWCYYGGFLSVSCRVQSSEQSPSHPHHVQIQAHLQPWQEPHSTHSRLRQPGKTWTHTHTVYSEFRCMCVCVQRIFFFPFVSVSFICLISL